MPSEASIIFAGLWSLVTAFFLYSAYWALAIRRVLQTGLYRRQALWLAGIGIYFGALGGFLTPVLTLQLNTLEINVLGGSFLAFGSILEFLWIDTTVRIARRSDPRLRDTLRWSKLRYLFWIITIFGAAGAIALSATQGVSAAGPYGGTLSGTLFFGAIALFLSAKRSGDSVLRRHLTWAALAIFFTWVVSQATNPLFHAVTDPYIVQSMIYPLVAAAAYSLYRSAKSLIPLGRLTSADVGPSNAPTPLNAPPVQ